MAIKSPGIDRSRITLPMLGEFLAGVLGTSVLVIHCALSDAPYIHLVAGAGALFGWAIGVLAAPLSSHEQQRFGEFAKVFSGVVSGYLLSKFDPIVTALVRVDEATGAAKIMSAPYAEQSLVALCSFGIALLFVFSARMYWSGGPAEARLTAWIDAQPDPKPTRNEAILQLTELGFVQSSQLDPAIAAWMDRQPDPKPSRSEAIRRLIERGVGAATE